MVVESSQSGDVEIKNNWQVLMYIFHKQNAKDGYLKPAYLFILALVLQAKIQIEIYTVTASCSYLLGSLQTQMMPR